MKSLVPRALALTIGSLFIATAPAVHAAGDARPDKPWLAQADAEARSARVSNVTYGLAFRLDGSETFNASTDLQFDLSDATQPLTIDLNKAELITVTANGKEIKPAYNQIFLTIPAENLKQGRNQIVIQYSRKHSTNGEGLHRMVDPVDQRVYTYSHFEPAAAQQMFPSFDQPDLKATYALRVTAPADWTVVSTTRESSVQDVQGGKLWTFPVTKKLSTYNFSLHAGPYKVWEDKSAKYPMRLFARQSVAPQVEPEEWFKFTKQGLAWFDDYYGVPYQFEKYDQLLVPDFLYGAMENAGAVTFAEAGFLHKDKMNTAQRHSLASVIMHEMAHQWFGDLVTMKWWNGLWLNESFASFMGTLATAEATEFKNAWQYFYSGGKTAAYVQDQQVTTHPIEVPVPTTANAFDNIDAITYSKGASTLKQLRHLLGEETFRKGVHNYLVKYSWQNAKLDDFIGSLGEAAGRDLGQWTQEWLYQPGVNTISANYSCKGGKIDSFTLKQTASAQFPVLREQRVQLGLFRDAGKELQLERKLAVTYKGAATEVPELKGAACPALVYPNYEDWGFVKARLDERSFKTARSSVRKVNDPMLRTMLWQSMWDGVRDGELPLNEFLQTALNNAGHEMDYALLSDVLGKTGTGLSILEKMAPEAAYTRRTNDAFEKLAWESAQGGKGDQNYKRRWLNSYIGHAKSKPDLDRLAAILDGKQTLKDVTLSQDLRWLMIQALSLRNYPGSEARIAAELERDKSDSGQSAATAARVLLPEAKAKTEALAQIHDLQTKLPFARVRTMMENIYPMAQSQLADKTAAERLAQLPALDKTAGPVYMRAYGASMIPMTCTPENVQRLSAAAEQYKDLAAGTRRALLVAQQEDARCVNIRKAMTVPLN